MKLLAEAVGSFLFMFVIGLVAVSGDPAFVPLYIGLALAAMVYMAGHISGAQFNPAVTVAVLMRGKMKSQEVLPYILAQIVGSVAAFGLASYITGRSVAIAPGEGVDIMRALIVEVVFTMMLVLTVLNVATHKKTAGNSFYGLAIGLVIVAAAGAGGAISGGAYNPAVAIGATLVNALKDGGTWSHLWLYLVGPTLGGVLGAIVFNAMSPAEERD
ncbi:MAG TPA: MIP/aquaporin family protein [Fimbriimonadaceae bacterium]|nr:MIP/aquaporin family protein [Fimbriimonadaceae bacterium]HRJ33414.1 MIP/aquaporin family protein [Fimbriimonadaceae bacterium]